MPTYKKGNDRAMKAVKLYAQHGNKEKAALEAGYSPKTARARQSEIIEKGTQELQQRGDKESKAILTTLGKSRQDIVDSFNELAFKQNRDLKLKAQMLSQLYQSEIGIDITGKLDQDQKQPVLNITLNNPQLNQAPKGYNID